MEVLLKAYNVAVISTSPRSLRVHRNTSLEPHEGDFIPSQL